MEESPLPAEEMRFLAVLNRLRALAFGENPIQKQGLSLSQLTLLDWIAASPASGIQAIAAGLGLTPPTVSVGVRQLEEAGLVERRPDPQDRRAVQLSLTERGQALHHRAEQFRRRKARRLLVALSAEERAQLLELLERAVRPTDEP